MEKVSRIVISRKDEKKIRDVEHALSLLGISIEDIKNIIEENQNLKQEVSELKEEIANYKQECKEYIQKELNQISVNVHNEVAKNTKGVRESIDKFLFKGSRINEQY